MENLEEKARKLAEKAHKKQKRKTTGEPFITHLVEVNNILKELTNDEEILAIGWLHDLVEDTDYNIQDLYDFPVRVISGIKAESENKELVWKERKKKQIEELKDAKSIPIIGENILLVTFADKLANLRDLLKLYKQLGLEKMFKDFNEHNTGEQYWYYNSFYEIFLEYKYLFDESLLDEYKSILSEIWG